MIGDLVSSKREAIPHPWTGEKMPRVGFVSSRRIISRSLSGLIVLSLGVTSFATSVVADSSVPDTDGAALATTVSVTWPPASTEASMLSQPFAKGARYWSMAAGRSRHASLGSVDYTQLHLSHYLVDNLAIEYGGMVGYINAERTSAGMLGGPQVGVRWHVAKGQRWSTYTEGLVGAVVQQYPLTEHSLRFNFDLQPGGGATYQLTEHTLCQGGVRWHHLSNARIRGKAHNFGYDGPMLFLQVMRSF